MNADDQAAMLLPDPLSVAIVIPAYNEERFIGRCLDSCIDQTSTPDEIIVVNNKSTDGTASIVRRYQAQYPHLNIRLLDQSEYQGIAPTRNCGFDAARSDIIGRIDADSLLAQDWVETVRRRFADPTIDAATGPVLYYDMPMPGLFFRIDHTTRTRLHRKSTDQRFLLGANMALRAHAWRSVRDQTVLDLEDRLHEDIDLAVVLFKNDFEVAYEPTLVAGMSGRRVESSTRDFYRYSTRYLRTTKAHHVKSGTALMTIFILLTLHPPIRLLRFFYDVENNRFTLAKLRQKFRGRGRRARLVRVVEPVVLHEPRVNVDMQCDRAA